MEGSHRIANGMEFVNDPAVIGKWKSVGSLEAGEEFSLEKLNASQKGELAEEIYFLPQGVSYWIFEGWTKGTLLLHYGGDAPILERSYQVVSREGRKYLLVTLPEEGHIAVFEQVDNTEYALESLGRRDNIDLPFVPDPDVVGLWKTVGFVERPSAVLERGALARPLDQRHLAAPKKAHRPLLRASRCRGEGIPLYGVENGQLRLRGQGAQLLRLRAGIKKSRRNTRQPVG